MRSSSLLLSCNLLLALVMTLLVASEVPAAQSAVSFKSTISINESIQPSSAAQCFLVGDISGAGLATQLGKVTVVSSDCINPISQTSFSFASNQLVFTVGNGDQIFAMYNGMLTSEGGVGVISGGYQLIGGTGRYSQATGAGTVQGVEDMTTGKGLVYLNGTISY
jgi:hypothetical protein